MPDPNAVGSLSSAQMDPNAPGLQLMPGSQNLPPRPLTVGQKIVQGALTAASAMAGPDANGKPRHGLASMLGGILGNSMTGLAAGANRQPGQAGGGLAAAGRGFQAVQQKQAQQRQQNFENQEESDKMLLEKASNARAQQQLIIQQHEMGRLDQQFQLEKDQFNETKLNRLATLRVENNNIRDRLLRLHAVPVPGAPEATTDEELSEWATKNMGTALGSDFNTLPIQDLETGKWTLYEVPKDQEMTINYGGKQYTVPVDPAILVKAAQDETRDQTDKVKAQADLLRAQADVNRSKNESSKSGQIDPNEQPELVDAIGTGHAAPERLGYMLTRNPALLEAVVKKYPDFDSSKLQSYAKTYQDFTSGHVSKSLNAGSTALQHLSELDALNTDASRIPGTRDYQAYENKVDTVATELATFYAGGNAPTEKAVANLKKTLDATFNRHAAILTQAQSMDDKLNSYKIQWENAAPSKAYEAKMPYISKEAQFAMYRFRGLSNFQFNPQTGQRIAWDGKKWVPIQIH